MHLGCMRLRQDARALTMARALTLADRAIVPAIDQSCLCASGRQTAAAQVTDALAVRMFASTGL
jgi:hypothetical protein